MSTRNPRIRDVDKARIVVATGHSLRTIGDVYAGRHVHPSTFARIEKASLELVLPVPPAQPVGAK